MTSIDSIIRSHVANKPMTFWKEDLFWEYISQDDLNDSECFEEFMEKVSSSGLYDVSASVLWKKSIISIATKAWDDYWTKYY